MAVLEKLKIYLGISDTSQDALLSLLIEKAEMAVLNRRYPFGYTDEEKDTTLSCYSDIVLDIAVYLYNKRGAEGQTGHFENGTSRSYESAGIPESYLHGIVPICKVL